VWGIFFVGICIFCLLGMWHLIGFSASVKPLTQKNQMKNTTYSFENLSPELKISVLNQNIVTADVELDKWEKDSPAYKALKNRIAEHQKELKKLLACNQN